MFDVIAFDADDTLWENEANYRAAKATVTRLLSKHRPAEAVEAALHAADVRNLERFGFGIKGFALSMIEAAIELTDGAIEGRDIQAILDVAGDMLDFPVTLLPHVEETIAALSATHRLMVITKGDLLDQETKLARSGLARHFEQVEIVSHKKPDIYRRLLDRHRIAPARFVMVGNSLRSDILPVLAIGGQAVYIPHVLTWAHELVTDANPADAPYHELEHIGLLPDLLRRLGG